MISTPNPFSLIKAADYTDEQINSLWVDAGAVTVDQVIEPKSRLSKLILGGKGSGKTHLLRYHGYHAMRLRSPPPASPVDLVREAGFLGVFIRANSIDASRFAVTNKVKQGWREAFALYFELRLVEALMTAVQDLTFHAPHSFDHATFLSAAREVVDDPASSKWREIRDFAQWTEQRRREIDHAVNNVVFTGKLKLRVPFTLGSICLEIGGWLRRSCVGLGEFSLIYLVDELENWSLEQQQVLNTLIRYSEGKATFRVGTRLYGIKTYETLGANEPIRDKAEYRAVYLDEILSSNKRFAHFARQLFQRRLEMTSVQRGDKADVTPSVLEPTDVLEAVDLEAFLAKIPTLRLTNAAPLHVRRFIEELEGSGLPAKRAQEVAGLLVSEFPPLLQKLNILLFYKRRSTDSVEKLAQGIHTEAREFLSARAPGRYHTALGHYKWDLFAQLCREQKRPVPYAGFETFLRMSSGNPKNLLILLGEAYSLAAFHGESISARRPLSIERQTEAAKEASRFVFEQDEHFGTLLDDVRHSVERLGELLKTARFAQNLPEVSPLVVTYDASQMTPRAQVTVKYALNWSFLFETKSGRPDRNSKAVHRKLHINPMMAARWTLPIGVRGDLSLSPELANAIFDGEEAFRFQGILKSLATKWEHPLLNRRRVPRSKNAIGQKSLL